MAEIAEYTIKAQVSKETIFETESLLTNELLLWKLKDEANDRAMALGYIQGLNDFANKLVERLGL